MKLEKYHQDGKKGHVPFRQGQKMTKPQMLKWVEKTKLKIEKGEMSEAEAIKLLKILK